MDGLCGNKSATHLAPPLLHKSILICGTGVFQIQIKSSIFVRSLIVDRPLFLALTYICIYVYNGYTRGLKQRKDLNSRNATNSPLWRHCRDLHGGTMQEFQMKVTGTFKNDAMLRPTSNLASSASVDNSNQYPSTIPRFSKNLDF